MFLDKSEIPIPAIRTDAYNRTSLILTSTGILLAGLLNFFMDKIGLFSFGM